jgi:hypothetical protein
MWTSILINILGNKNLITDMLNKLYSNHQCVKKVQNVGIFELTEETVKNEVVSEMNGHLETHLIDKSFLLNSIG